MSKKKGKKKQIAALSVLPEQGRKGKKRTEVITWHDRQTAENKGEQEKFGKKKKKEAYTNLQGTTQKKKKEKKKKTGLCACRHVPS